jgi:pimeloyl-ACP methyl ester carboxylesterase
MEHRYSARVRARLYLPLLLLALLPGCARQTPLPAVTPIKASSPAELQKIVLSMKPEVAQFRLRGPFAVTERRDIRIPLGAGIVVEADLFLCAASKAPLVIVLHGHENSKEDHEFQAMHLASWCMHGLAIQLPNRGPWIGNGRTLARLVKAIRSSPQLLDERIDTERIILAGHSFGATAVAVALGERAPAAGGVLLDPAGIGRELPDSLKRIAVPVMVIGADEYIWPTRNRSQFYRFMKGPVAEISIRDATHEDAQYPVLHASSTSNDPLATEEAQLAFVSALTAAAFSLTATGGIGYAWDSFESGQMNGTLFNGRKK